jgi:uncharacterized membrane protein
MGTLHDAKILGGIGSILMLFIPIAGQILVLIAAKYISDTTNDKSIFNNVLYAMIFSIIGSIAATMLIYTSMFAFLMNPAGALMGVITSLGVAFIFLLLGAIFLRRGFNRIAELVNVSHFRTAATLFLIGAILTIIMVGLLIIFIAEIFMIVAFFSLPDQLPTQAPPSSSLPPPPT